MKFHFVYLYVRKTIESYEIKYCAKEKAMNMDAMNKKGENLGRQTC